jgi:hypothetical protein
LRQGRQQDRQRWSQSALRASRVDDRNKASNDRSKPRRGICEANAPIRRRGRGVLEFEILMFTLALIRSQREGEKIPRRIPENAKDRGSISRPFSNLFNVAASRSAQMTTKERLRLARPKVKASELPIARLHSFSSGMKRRTGPPVCRDGPVLDWEAQQRRILASERSASRTKRTAFVEIWGQSRAVCKRGRLEVRSSGSWERWTASVLCPVVRAPGRERRGAAVHTPMICINSAAHSMG